MKSLREAKWLYAILTVLVLSWSAPVSARWMAVDPKADQYPSLSPYVYCANNPMKYVDPDGRVMMRSKATQVTSDRMWEESWVGGLLYDMATDPANCVMVGTISAPASRATGGLKTLIGRIFRKLAGKTDDAAGAAKALETVEVKINKGKFPETAQHVTDAQQAGHPTELTIDRAGTASRRAQALKGQQKIPGKQLDEYPPAMFKEGGAGASVRAVSPADNAGAGASMGNQLRNFRDGTKIIMKIVE